MGDLQAIQWSLTSEAYGLKIRAFPLVGKASAHR